MVVFSVCYSSDDGVRNSETTVNDRIKEPPKLLQYRIFISIQIILILY